MKKLIFLIALLMLITVTGCANTKTVEETTKADKLLANDIHVKNDEGWQQPDSGNLELYPFVYPVDTWAIENVVGPGDFKEGYFYVKNLKTGDIRQIFNYPVDITFTSGDIAYFKFEGSIFRYDHKTDKLDELFESDSNYEFNVVVLGGNEKDFAYFVEDGALCKYNLNDKTKTILCEGCYGNSFTVKNDTAVLCSVSKNQSYLTNVDYVINFKDKFTRIIVNDIEINRFININDEYYGMPTEYAEVFTDHHSYLVQGEEK